MKATGLLLGLIFVIAIIVFSLMVMLFRVWDSLMTNLGAAAYSKFTLPPRFPPSLSY